MESLPALQTRLVSSDVTPAAGCLSSSQHKFNPSHIFRFQLNAHNTLVF